MSLNRLASGGPDNLLSGSPKATGGISPWRLLVHQAGSPARNMAIDEALLREVREPVLRIYEWNVPAVSLGYFQPAALAGDRPFIRRYTGGGLVDHARDVTYTLVVPRKHPWME